MKRLNLIEFTQLESKNKGKSILDDLPFDFLCIFRYMYKTRFCFRLLLMARVHVINPILPFLSINPINQYHNVSYNHLECFAILRKLCNSYYVIYPTIS
jgi:DNA-directed RNA polymerase subunit N (RpoN/RPB10)